MKKQFKKSVALTLTTILAAGTLTAGSIPVLAADNDSSEEKTTIYAATSGSPRPFSFYDDDNELTGHNIELVQAIFDKLPQYDLVFEVTDFTSIFAGLDSDKYQLGVNNFGMNEERKEKYLFTDPIFDNALIVVANKNIDLSEVSSYEDLAGLSFVGQAGVNQTTNVENYNEANPDNQINIVYTEEDLAVQLSNVESGKYDFTTIDKPMYYGYYQPEFNFDLNVSDLDGYTEGLYSYLLVSKGNEQLVEDINEALKEVVEDGTSKEINEKYFFDDYSPSYE
jgi:polar amino acid transport system substrate-binding protein